MLVYKLTDGDPDGVVYAKDWRDLLPNIKEGLMDLEYFADTKERYAPQIEVQQMTEEEFNALPPK